MTTALEWLGPLAAKATNHARDLEDQANRLEKLLTDVSQFAQKAVNASNAYTNLAEAIKEALKIAMEAETVAIAAQEEVGKELSCLCLCLYVFAIDTTFTTVSLK